MNENERVEQEKRLEENLSKIKNSLIVMSGKGGVGKTSVAVNLSYALSLSDRNVGILDIDLHGPNIARMLGIEAFSLYGSESGISPVEVTPNLKAVSISLLGSSMNNAIIWRGPMKAGVIKQFLSDVDWGELDYLIIDAPPGTGDEPLSVCQLIQNLSGAIIVTTPQDVAILDARRSISFAKEMNIPFIGVVENMSGFICPHCGKETNIFKKGGGEKAALEMGAQFLGRILFDPQLVELSDSGQPFVCYGSDSGSAKAFSQIVNKIEHYMRL